MRRIALSAVVTLIAGLVFAAPAGAAASITITPSTDLLAGQTVTVSGTGFNANAALDAAECKAGPVTISDCDISKAVFETADSSGAYSFDFVVSGQLVTTNGAVDCLSAPGACVIGVADSVDIAGTAVTAPISFQPVGPPQRGVLHVPAARVDGDSLVTISGTKFTPEAPIDTAICAAHPTDAQDCYGPYPGTADGSGAFDQNLFATSSLLTGNGDTVDCTVDGACVYASWDTRDFADTVATKPQLIAPQVAGSLSVDPSTNLHDGDSVTLSGSGWPADLVVSIAECDGTGGTAACSGYGEATTDANGAFSTPYTVSATSHNGASFDCETGPCSIVVEWVTAGSIVTASQPISFDVTPIPMTSHYTADELAAVTTAANTLGVSTAEEQHLGTWGLAWVLLITNSGVITPVPDSGPGTLTTEWLPSEYSVMNADAATHGTTLAEFQKTGALLLAYVLAAAT